MDRRLAWRMVAYVLCVVAAGYLCGISSVWGGYLAVARAAVLGGLLAMALPVINLFVAHRQYVLIAALVGSVFGCVAGTLLLTPAGMELGWAIASVSPKGYYVSGLLQSDDSVVFATAAYGFAMHLAYAAGRKYRFGFFGTLGLVYLASVVCNCARMPVLLFEQPITVVLGSFGNNFLFAVFWGLPVRVFDPVKKSEAPLRGRWWWLKVGTAAILLMVIPGYYFVGDLFNIYMNDGH